jgi:hypothetical protein
MKNFYTSFWLLNREILAATITVSIEFTGVVSIPSILICPLATLAQVSDGILPD